MDEVVILRREVRPRMLVFSLFCVAIASSYLDQIFAIEDDEDFLFGEMEQAHISQLGSTKEDNLNCFLQFDQFIADKWLIELNLREFDLNSKVPSSAVVNRLQNDENDEYNRLKIDTRMMLDGLTSCMTNLTEQLKNPWIKKCMDDLLINEIESDNIISDPELFDNTLSLPSSTFLNIRELVQVFFPNKTESDLRPDETEIFKTAVNYSMKHGNSREKIFVFDQSCEWKNLAALKNREGSNIKDMLNVFKNQVMRSVSIQLARAVMNTGDLKPGRWISVYRRWVPVRLQTLKALNSTLKTLEKQRFKTEELCGYITTLANHFSGVELKAILPQRISPLHLITKDLKDKVKSKEVLLCKERSTKECQSFRVLGKSYEEDLRCVELFGELLSRHILNSIIERYHANIVPRITYPEIVCKKSAPNKKIAIRYCRCVGSFCTTRDVGELNSDLYRLNGDVVEKV